MLLLKRYIEIYIVRNKWEARILAIWTTRENEIKYYRRCFSWQKKLLEKLGTGYILKHLTFLSGLKNMENNYWALRKAKFDKSIAECKVISKTSSERKSSVKKKRQNPQTVKNSATICSRKNPSSSP